MMSKNTNVAVIIADSSVKYILPKSWTKAETNVFKSTVKFTSEFIGNGGNIVLKCNIG